MNQTQPVLLSQSHLKGKHTLSAQIALCSLDAFILCNIVDDNKAELPLSAGKGKIFTKFWVKSEATAAIEGNNKCWFTKFFALTTMTTTMTLYIISKVWPVTHLHTFYTLGQR